MPSVSALFIYPVKSLGGVSLPFARVTDRGFEHDRRWMLVDSQHHFLTQRQLPGLALFSVSLEEEELLVTHRTNDARFRLPLQPAAGEELIVQVWQDLVRARAVSAGADEWFSRELGLPCRLVYMPDNTRREVDKDYAHDLEITAFSDAFPFLLIGQASLNDLNARLDDPLPMNRFRPNIVLAGSDPFAEDGFREFSIAGVRFFGVKPCARCVVTTTDQETAERGKEPLKTLATYRMRNNKIYFGQNLLHQGTGIIQVGDEVDVLEQVSN